ncbi:MAG TPA: 23S rRNA (guanosine(2251)-2'-O)-methyltransferase RlmB [Acidimicrobiia bacterium]|nr:23S rRNA (guanosine(2251)-2'-O)-methyltransferase RlmB [Acidimicrobiia bacterium]
MALAGIGDRVEGVNAVRAAAKAGRVVELWVEQSRWRQASDLIELVARSGGAVRQVESVREQAETEAPQGVIARCRPLLLETLEEMAAVERPALIVLDHVTDPHNLGAIARSARAAGMTGLVSSSRRAAPFSATAFKAASGALETLPVAVVNSIPDALSRLHQMGVWSVGLDASGESDLFELPLLTEPVAIVVGEEGIGLSQLVRQRLEVTVRIPLAGDIESLNASVAAALASFEVMRVRSAQRPHP